MARIVEWLLGPFRGLRRGPALPRVGDWIWVPSSFFMSHGRDDFAGGRAQVSSITNDTRGVSLTIAERPGATYYWANLGPRQSELRQEFGDTKAHLDPDLRDEFNDD